MSPARHIAVVLFIVTLPFIVKPFSCTETGTQKTEKQTAEHTRSEFSQILEEIGYRSIFDEPSFTETKESFQRKAPNKTSMQRQTPNKDIAAEKDDPMYRFIGQPIDEKEIRAIRNGTISPLRQGAVLKKNNLVITATSKGKLVYARVLRTMPNGGLPTIFHIIEIEHGIFVKQLCRYIYQSPEDNS